MAFEARTNLIMSTDHNQTPLPSFHSLRLDDDDHHPSPAKRNLHNICRKHQHQLRHQTRAYHHAYVPLALHRRRPLKYDSHPLPHHIKYENPGTLSPYSRLRSRHNSTTLTIPPISQTLRRSGLNGTRTTLITGKFQLRNLNTMVTMPTLQTTQYLENMQDSFLRLPPIRDESVRRGLSDSLLPTLQRRNSDSQHQLLVEGKQRGLPNSRLWSTEYRGDWSGESDSNAMSF